MPTCETCCVTGVGETRSHTQRVVSGRRQLLRTVHQHVRARGRWGGGRIRQLCLFHALYLESRFPVLLRRRKEKVTRLFSLPSWNRKCKAPSMRAAHMRVMFVLEPLSESNSPNELSSVWADVYVHRTRAKKVEWSSRTVISV